MDQFTVTKRDDTKIRKSRGHTQTRAHYIPPAQRLATIKILSLEDNTQIDRVPEDKSKTSWKEDVNILGENFNHICNSLEKFEIAPANRQTVTSQNGNNFLRYKQNCDTQILDLSTRSNDDNRRINIEVSTKPEVFECQQYEDGKRTSDSKNLPDDNETSVTDTSTCSDDKIVENDHEDLDHVIELYDFSPNFKTRDLIRLYSSVYVEGTFIKWCDDTHALLVFTSSAQATRALNIRYQIVKSRPLSKGSDIAISIAYKSNLKSVTKRPRTSMQTARRLITTHLGKKSSISKEEVEHERQILQVAREKKKQERKNSKLFGKIWDLQSEQTE